MHRKMKENKKGFTLAELLIVVAIIAVLVAISIPIFTSQLEKSRDAVYTKKLILSKLQLVGHLQNQNQLVQLLRLIFLTLL